jgi:hypothetical protein
MPEGIIIVITLLILAIIVAILLPMAQKAAAVSGVDPFVNVSDNRDVYIRRSKERYNKFSDTNDVTKGNFAGANDPYEMEIANRELQEVSQTADLQADPTAPTLQGIKNIGTQYKVAPPSILLADARRCEAKKGRDACSALGTGKMKECGVCIKGGTSYGEPDKEGQHIGGMLILGDEKYMAEEEARNTGGAPLYNPTLGECPEGYFFVDKAACTKAVNRQDCKEAGESGGFEGGKNIEGKTVIDKCAAAPLAGDTIYVFETKGRKFDVFLRIIPPSGITVNVDVNGKKGSFDKESRLRISKVTEGQQLTVSITEAKSYVSKDGVERRGILLQWEDESGRRKGNFESSLIAVNGAKGGEDRIFPNLRKLGTYAQSVQIAEPRGTDGSKMLLTTPWLWGNVATVQTVNFAAKVPGTFADPIYPEDRPIVPYGPLIAQKSTLELLRAGPCMKPDQKPGKYGATCLKTLFIGAGGDYYRGKLVSDGLDKLNTIGDGSAETISNYLSGLYTVATRGKTPTGMKASMVEINDAAMKMFGMEIVSPCEDIMEDEEGRIMLVPKMGGLDADCLDYLWMNTGNDRSRGNEDPTRNTNLKNTYTWIWDRYSGLRSKEGTKKEREANPFTACQRTGTLAPKNASGRVNDAAVYEANSKGSLENIQNYYNKIHYEANFIGGTGTVAQSKRAEHDAALEKCYGVKRSGSATMDRETCAKPSLLQLGARVSISPASDLMLFGRHAGFVMWTHRNDGSWLFRNDGTFRVVESLSKTPGAISLESVNFPRYYVTHSNNRILIAPVNNTVVSQRNAEWFARPAKNGNSNHVSLENNNIRGMFIGKLSDQVRLLTSTASNANDISWQVKPGLA